jgi:hypothetical protein
MVGHGGASIACRTVNDYRGGEIWDNISNAFLQTIGADALSSIDMTKHEFLFLANVDNDRKRSPTPQLIGRDLADSPRSVLFRSRK